MERKSEIELNMCNQSNRSNSCHKPKSSDQQQELQPNSSRPKYPPTERPSNPFHNLSYLSQCTFSYVWPLLKLGKQRPIQESDLPSLDTKESSVYNRMIIEQIWNEECVKKQNKSLGKALFYNYVKNTWWAEILLFVNMIVRIGQAIVLGLLMEQFGKYETRPSSSSSATTTENNIDENDNVIKSCIYAAIFILCGFIAFPTKQQQFFETYRKGLQLKIGLVAAIYSKVLRLPSITSTSTASSISSSGYVTNLVSNDVDKIVQTSVVLPFLIQGPFIAIIILIVGIIIVGPVFATGFGLLLILVPFQSFLSKRFVYFRSKVASLTDERVTMVSQAVSGVRVMKMNVSFYVFSPTFWVNICLQKSSFYCAYDIN